MFTPIKKVPNYKKVDAKIVNELIERINTLSKITTGGGIFVQTSPMGIHLSDSRAIRRGRCNWDNLFEKWVKMIP